MNGQAVDSSVDRERSVGRLRISDGRAPDFRGTASAGAFYAQSVSR
jgi:hypothetical protein